MKKNFIIVTCVILIFPLRLIVLSIDSDRRLLNLTINSVRHKGDLSIVDKIDLTFLEVLEADPVDYELSETTALEYSIFSLNLALVERVSNLTLLEEREKVFDKIKDNKLFKEGYLTQVESILKS
ncbi:MAG: hypothetical protein OQK04_06435 [Kangiellaceae bacterium]|nr:hypothetical protein [Kangiellaceae bacterium]MCW8998336.1 hypothetical protein [Kangiellaceae bacterium]